MAVAVYCRVSSEDQAERGTIEIQKDFAAKYVNLYNLDVFDSEYDPIDITDIAESLGTIKDILNKILEFIQKIFK